MTRRRQTIQVGQPLIVEPNGVYNAPQVRQLLGLAKSTLSTEIARGRLRVSRRAGRYWFLGSWILEWLAGGERQRSTRPAKTSHNGTSPHTQEVNQP